MKYDARQIISNVDKARILVIANQLMGTPAKTITLVSSPRSAGSAHDYFSEADYWWPDPEGAHKRYLRRDGLSNPNTFWEHRKLLIQMSSDVATLTTAWVLTSDRKYATHALKHLTSWFVDPNTYMRPHLRYSQAIAGGVTGRSIGIVDGIHLLDVALSIMALSRSDSELTPNLMLVRAWFDRYLAWLINHPFGKRERREKNNHGTCWLLQVAVLSTMLSITKLQEYCRSQFKDVLLPGQLASDGSFPYELARTRPYNYSLFNLEMMAAICQILAKPEQDLWRIRLQDGRCMQNAIDFMLPYVDDRHLWPFPADVMHFEDLPKRYSFLLFAGIAFQEERYIRCWTALDPDADEIEIRRNLFLRQPLLWFTATLSQ